MSISKYSDEELLEEVKKRGFKVELGEDNDGKFILLGGVTFELTS